MIHHRFLLRTAAPILACALVATAHAAARPGSARDATPAEIAEAARATGLTPDEIARQIGVAREGAATAPAGGEAAPPPTGTTEPAIRPDSLAPNPRPAADPSEPFGFDLFRFAPATFEPQAYGPVDADVTIGPGDELTLTVWGDDQLALTLPVGREGRVTLPEAGPVTVAGLTLEQAQARVRAALARVYGGLRADDARSTTHVALAFGRLRTLQVFLLGEVTRPGSYTVSGGSRVLNALYAAGGPTRTGSLRDVRVVRGGRTLATVDLYDVILGGDPGALARLETGDVVFVPPARRRARVQGPVRRPGLYELRDGDQLAALLELAGGPLPAADLEHAQIDRVVPPALRDSLRGQGRVAIDADLRTVFAGADDPAIQDADVLTLSALPDRRANTVHLDGRGIQRAGDYEWKPGMRVSDLVRLAGGVTPDAFLERAQLVRTAPDSTRAQMRFDVGRALAGDEGEDLWLRPLDDVSIRSRWDLQERQEVSVHGLVRHPGTYELLEGMTLADLLLAAGGLTDDAYAVLAELARVNVSAGDSHRLADTLRVPLARDLVHSPAAAATLMQPNDAVFIRRDPAWHEQEFVTVTGEVAFPGTYALTRRDERVADLVRRAGGLTPTAYAQGARFIRAGHARLAIDLPQALRRPRADGNLVLLRGDTLVVPRYMPTVAIEGAVLNPVVALHQPGAGVGWYLTQASGLRTDADRRGIVVISPSGRVRRGGRPEPGSRIVVPARPQTEPTDHLKDFATLMSILASAATTVYLVGQSAR